MRHSQSARSKLNLYDIRPHETELVTRIIPLLKSTRQRASCPGPLKRYRAKIAGCLLLVSFNSIASRAAADPAACSAAYERGQRLMTSAHLLDAASQFRYCGSPACPAIMHAECLRFLDRVEAATPSIVVRVRPEIDVPVRFTLDDDAERALDGHAVVLDPGTHQLRLRATGYAVREQRFLVTEGESLKTIEVSLEVLPGEPLRDQPPSSLASPAPSPTPSVVPWVVTGAVASAGAAGFVYWGLQARSGEAALESCSPDCSRSQVADVKRDYLLSNVSLGVGVTGLVAMGVWYVVRSSGSARRATTLPGLTISQGPTVSMGAAF